MHGDIWEGYEVFNPWIFFRIKLKMLSNLGGFERVTCWRLTWNLAVIYAGINTWVNHISRDRYMTGIWISSKNPYKFKNFYFPALLISRMRVNVLSCCCVRTQTMHRLTQATSGKVTFSIYVVIIFTMHTNKKLREYSSQYSKFYIKQIK